MLRGIHVCFAHKFRTFVMLCPAIVDQSSTVVTLRSYFASTEKTTAPVKQKKNYLRQKFQFDFTDLSLKSMLKLPFYSWPRERPTHRLHSALLIRCVTQLLFQDRGTMCEELSVSPGGFCKPGPCGAGGAAGSPVDDQTGGDRAKSHPKNDLQRSTGQSPVQAVRTTVVS